jgi:hypothetical protein
VTGLLFGQTQSIFKNTMGLRGPQPQIALCHPDRPHYGNGLCYECWIDHPEHGSIVRWRTQIKRKFGLSEEEYNAILRKQNGVCAICKRQQKGRRLAVDHDHVTGKVRGLLCISCNRVVGYLDNEQWREAADRYITEN